MKFLIQDTRKEAWQRTAWVVAPPGYCKKADGSLGRDGYFSGGPEWGDRSKAHEFKSHRAAARVANRCNDKCVIREI